MPPHRANGEPPDPWTATVDSGAAAERAAPEALYPCVLKPVFSHDWRAVHGLDRVLMAHDPAEFERHAEQGLAHGLPMVANEYVPGGDGRVEEAIVVRAPDGSFPVSFAVRKIRQFPVGFGAASLCVSATLPETTEMTQRLLDEAGFVGVAGVEVKRHLETGERFVLDANVRLPTQWGVGDAAGAEASRRAIACLGGRALGPAPRPRDGVKLVFPELDARAALIHLRGATGVRGKALAARRILGSYRGTQDAGLLDPRDPAPGLSRLGAAIARAGSTDRSRAGAEPAAHPPPAPTAA